MKKTAKNSHFEDNRMVNDPTSVVGIQSSSFYAKKDECAQYTVNFFSYLFKLLKSKNI